MGKKRLSVDGYLYYHFRSEARLQEELMEGANRIFQKLVEHEFVERTGRPYRVAVRPLNETKRLEIKGYFPDPVSLKPVVFTTLEVPFPRANRSNELALQAYEAAQGVEAGYLVHCFQKAMCAAQPGVAV